MPPEHSFTARLMFAQSWEDPECDRTALRIRPGETVLAVTSGGDNVLDLLRDDPARIVAIDINPAQAWLFELKRAAFLQLDHAALCDLLGLGDNEQARGHYRYFRMALSAPARTYFDEREHWFGEGLLQQGGFERYFALLRRIIALAVGRSKIAALFRLDPDQQADFFREQWNGWRWRLLMRIGCSKAMLGNRLDPSWFADSASSDFGSHFLQLARHVLVTLPARDNWFLAQILLGRYQEGAVPAYLRPECFAVIRNRIERVDLVIADIADGLRAQPDRSVDAFALSNVFEYSPGELFDAGKDEIVRVANSGARIAHRNLLAPRRFAQDERFVVDHELSERLQRSDRGFIYSRFEAAWCL